MKGEFEKRIEAEAKMWLKHHKIIPDRAFKQWMDEAREEFPLPKEFDYPTYVEAKDWFEKWFGDSKQ